MYLTQWFEPEPNIVKGIAFVRALEAAGHDVTVVTGFPNYPTGRIYPGYRLRVFQREMLDGVRVERLPLYPSHDASSLRRSLNFLSFFLSALIYGLLRGRRFDLVYAYHPPITVGLAAVLTAAVWRRPVVLDVQDLWPDTVAATGMAGAGRLARTLGALCGFVYRRSRGIVVQSAGMRTTLIERGVTPDKITTIRNWADPDAIGATGTGVSSSERFSIVYGGNLGRAQALESVIDAAAIVGATRDDIELIFHGDGIDADRLRDHAERTGATIVSFRPRVPKQEITAIFADADALLLHLADQPLFAITIPSKTQFYLAIGRPIVAGVAGEVAQLLRDSGAAIVAPPEHPVALAAAIVALADTPAEERGRMAAAGRSYYRSALSFDIGMAKTLDLLAQAAPPNGKPPILP